MNVLLVMVAIVGAFGWIVLMLVSSALYLRNW